MKKNYIAPEIEITALRTAEMLAASITNVTGPEGLTRGDDNKAPEEANSHERVWGNTLWD